MPCSPIRVLFCLATAVLGAAIADLLVEGASNAGRFGMGRYTDGTTADVLPVLLVGVLVLLVHVAVRTYAALEQKRNGPSLLRLTEEALSGGLARLLPQAFALQILVLFVMETAEQYVVWHHGFGGFVWLGGPVAASLCVHFAVCAGVALLIRGAVRALATTAVRIIRIVRSSARRVPRSEAALCVRAFENAISYRPIFARSGLAERGPPTTLNVSKLAALREISCSLVQQFALRSPRSPVRQPSS